MKKLFTLSLIAVFALGAFSQVKELVGGDFQTFGKPVGKLPIPDRAKNFSQKKHSNAGRSLSEDILIAYRTNEETWADENGHTASGFIWEMNKNLPNESFASLRNMAVLFDSLQENTDNFQTYKNRFFPKAKSTVKINSIYFPALYDKNIANKPDTFKISVFKLPANYTWANPTLAGVIAGAGANENLNTQNLTIWADSTFDFIPSQWALDSTSTQNGMVYFLGRENMNIQLNPGETFGFRVDFTGDTSNRLVVYAGYHERCQDTAFAASAIIPNSIGYMNFRVNQTLNLSGVIRDDIVYNVSPPCNRFYFQNISMFAEVEVTVDNFGVVAVPSVTEACPGSQVELQANYFGSSEATFEWRSRTGTLSSTNDEEVTLTLPNTNQNDTITLIGTDSTGLVKDTSTIIIRNNGIGISFPNSPFNINCGALGTAVSSVSGNTAAPRVYEWDIDLDPQIDTVTSSGNMGRLLPGNYSVTVTNARGCKSSASFVVQYNNGVTNNVNFVLPDVIPGGAAQVCVNAPNVYTNTSTNTIDWEATWTFGDQNGSFDNNIDAFFAYTSTGTYTVRLSMDSAGCKFNGPERNVQVLPATNSACINSINEISFEQSVELMPNPNNGFVNIAVSNIEKGVSIRVFNILGSEVKRFADATATGAFSKSFDFTDLSKGAYIVKVQSGSKSAVKRMIVNR